MKAWDRRIMKTWMKIVLTIIVFGFPRKSSSSDSVWFSKVPCAVIWKNGNRQNESDWGTEFRLVTWEAEGCQPSRPSRSYNHQRTQNLLKLVVDMKLTTPSISNEEYSIITEEGEIYIRASKQLVRIDSLMKLSRSGSSSISMEQTSLKPFNSWRRGAMYSGWRTRSCIAKDEVCFGFGTWKNGRQGNSAYCTHEYTRAKCNEIYLVCHALCIPIWRAKFHYVVQQIHLLQAVSMNSNLEKANKQFHQLSSRPDPCFRADVEPRLRSNDIRSFEECRDPWLRKSKHCKRIRTSANFCKEKRVLMYGLNGLGTSRSTSHNIWAWYTNFLVHFKNSRWFAISCQRCQTRVGWIPNQILHPDSRVRSTDFGSTL